MSEPFFVFVSQHRSSLMQGLQDVVGPCPSSEVSLPCVADFAQNVRFLGCLGVYVQSVRLLGVFEAQKVRALGYPDI